MRDSQASFLETPPNQAHNQVMRIMHLELFYSLIGNNLIHTGKAAKFSLHSAGVFYYTQNEFQNQMRTFVITRNVSDVAISVYVLSF